MMKTWTCAWCGQERESRVGFPWGWFTLEKPGEILVCSVKCMAHVFAEMRKDAAQAAAEWSADVGSHHREEVPA